MNREALNEAMGKIPFWKQLLICWVLKRGQWKIAHAHNVAAAHAHNVTGDFELFVKLRDAGDILWAKLYGLDIAKFQRCRSG